MLKIFDLFVFLKSMWSIIMLFINIHSTSVLRDLDFPDFSKDL